MRHRGKVVWTDGSSYEGEFVDDKYHGNGLWTYDNGVTLKGEFVNGKYKDGEATLYWPNGNVQYVGGFVNGLRHGYGEDHLQGAERRIYRGQYRDGKKHGYGELSYPDRDGFVRFKGEYVDDYRHGYGVYTFDDGTQYRGMLVNDLNLRNLGKFGWNHVQTWEPFG